MTTNPDAWRDGWDRSDVFSFWRVSEAVYFAQLWDEVGLNRHRRGRFYGTSPVEEAVIDALERRAQLGHSPRLT